MILVMPMAGRGSRFAEVGVSTPKPLIPVRGQPMYAWAMDSLPLGLVRRVVFVCLREHLEGLALQRDIERRYAALHPIVVALDGVTEGQACTVLTAKEHLVPDEPLVIYNADTYCRTRLAERLPTLPSGTSLFSVFRAPGDKWSFARTDGTDRVVETAEKRRISEWCSTGLYHFSRAGDFVEHAEAMIREDDRSGREFYVAPVYNRLLRAGADVRIDVADEVWALGTPEDLADFEARYPR